VLSHELELLGARFLMLKISILTLMNEFLLHSVAVE